MIVIQIWAVDSCDLDIGSSVVLETGLVGACDLEDGEKLLSCS